MTNEVTCPISCVKSGCDDPPDFLQKHNAFVLTMVGILSGALGYMLTYMLKSRCTKIQCCGLNCERKPLELEPEDININSVS